MKINDKTLILLFGRGEYIYFKCYLAQCCNEPMFYQCLHQLNTLKARERYNRIIVYSEHEIKNTGMNYKDILSSLELVCMSWDYELIVLKHRTDIEKYLEK